MPALLETERFILRNITKADAEGMYLLDSDPEVHRFLGNKPISSKNEALKTISLLEKQYEEIGFGRMAIISKANDEFIGWAGIKYETKLRAPISYNDIGYRLRTPFWGLGIATETAIATLKYGFEQLNLEKICAAADFNHTASNKVLKKIGLIKTDTFCYENVECNWYELTKEESQNLNL